MDKESIKRLYKIDPARGESIFHNEPALKIKPFRSTYIKVRNYFMIIKTRIKLETNKNE